MTQSPAPTPPPTHASELACTRDLSQVHLARFTFWLPWLFVLLIIVGAVLLLTPYATPHIFDTALGEYIPVGEPITPSEAFFTATSAACVTGLTVRDTARDFTPFGQVVIASLFQLGALCVITFGSLLVMRINSALSPLGYTNASSSTTPPPKHSLLRLVCLIVLVTLAFELLGAALLYPLWQDPADGTLSLSTRAGMSLFHAASAFCNAGFDITGHSLTGYRYAMLTHAVILPLIVVGGLGFPVLEDIFRVVRARLFTRYRDPSNQWAGRLSWYTKLVLGTSACLYLWGVVTIGAGQMMPYIHESMEHGVTAHAQAPDPLSFSTVGGVLADTSFMSVTSRTAGFNAMPIDELQPAGRFSVVTLMFVGGSLGSSAGGLTTLVFALLMVSVVATLRQRAYTLALGQPIRWSLIRQILALAVCFILLVTASTLLLCLMEPFTFQALLFEAVSASTGTGLSLGITPDLTEFGRKVVAGTMFLGRVGPLVLLGWVMQDGFADSSIKVMSGIRD